MPRLHAAAAACLAIALAQVACNSDTYRFFTGGSGETAPGGRRTDTLIIGRSADGQGFDPARFTDNESVEVCEQLFEHLVRLTPDGNGVQEELATRWETSEDERAWTFHLRPGVRFHDGTPVDAEAVRFSFERQLDRRHPFHRTDFAYWDNTLASVVRAVEVIDPLTVRIHIYKPYAPFLASMAMYPVSIVSPTAVRKYGDQFDKNPVGSGPFMFVARLPGDRVILRRFDGYWGEKPRIAQLVFKTIPDARQRLVALESEAVDVAYDILPEELQFVELHPDLQIVRGGGLNVTYLAMNTGKAPWSHPGVRHAANYAVNRVPLVKLIWQGNAQVARGPLPPAMWGYDPAVREYPYDPGVARQLLGEAVAAGVFDPSRRYTLYAPSTTRPYMPSPERIARAIQQNLADVGIQTELVLQDFPAHLAAVERGEHDLCLMGWAADVPDPDNFLYLLLSRDNIVPGIARNLAFYRDATVSGLVQYAQETRDPDERTRYYRDAQVRIAEDAPWVPLAHSQVAVAARTTVHGLQMHPSSRIYYKGVWLGP